MDTHSPPNHRLVEIDLLALDLNTCTRCSGTLANTEKALEILRPALEATGTQVRFTKTLVTSEAQARQHRFVSSPTLRIDGRDLAFETLESRCDSCTDLCGGAEGTDCRVWQYQGEEYTEAPVGLIVEALLKVMGAGTDTPSVAAPAYEGVPANLKRFFAGRSGAARADACCSPEEQATCCEPAEKSACCASSAPTTCGCR
jgi:hypothetical protein